MAVDPYFFRTRKKTTWLTLRLGWGLRHWLRQNAAFIGYYFIPGYAALRGRSMLEPFSKSLTLKRYTLGAACWIMQLAFFDLLYEIIFNLVKPSCRPLSPPEIETGRQVFGDAIRWELVMIDEKAVSTKFNKAPLAYVSFNTINYWGTPSDDTLVHELIHVWQYQRFGAVYIAKALVAQKTIESYDYTRYENWRAATSLLDFNAEQQGEIAVDYYRVLNGRRPLYRAAAPEDLALYTIWFNAAKNNSHADGIA